MALESDNEVPFTSNSFYDNYYNDNNDDDESSIVSKLMLKCKNLLSKNKHYKHDLTSLTKEFENKKKFLILLNQMINLLMI